MMRISVTLASGVAIVLLAAQPSRAIVVYSDVGEWPSDWPEELEPLRQSARTIRVANARHENIYEIRLSDRKTFERIWPVVVKLKTPGAPLRIRSIQREPAEEKRPKRRNATPTIRILAPSDSLVGEGKSGSLRAGPPWPKDIIGDGGELPEYVTCHEQDGQLKWVAAKPKVKPERFPPTHLHRHRARIDIELVVDGDIVNLNRIRLPAHTPIDDVRLLD